MSTRPSAASSSSVDRARRRRADRGDGALRPARPDAGDAARRQRRRSQRALGRCDAAALDALGFAAERIRAFHERQKPQDLRFTDALGVELGWRWTAIEAVGLYVPGGTAAYPSSVLMNAIPAKVAGCDAHRHGGAGAGRQRSIRWCSPRPRIAGVDEVYRVGGAQAIAALAYGTATIAPVAKIVGPGNAYVAAAKRRVFGHVGIDMIAGPSEVLILADASARCRLGRGRSPGPGRARRGLAIDPHHRCARTRRRRRPARCERQLATPAAPRDRRRELARLRRHRPGAEPRRGGAPRRPARRRAPRDHGATMPRRSRPPSATPAPSSSAATRPRRSATMSAAPTMSCRRRARPASPPASACSTS